MKRKEWPKASATEGKDGQRGDIDKVVNIRILIKTNASKAKKPYLEGSIISSTYGALLKIFLETAPLTTSLSIDRYAGNPSLN